MSAQANPKQHTAKTTTLVIDQLQEYALLEKRFRLERYVIPDTLRFRKNPTDFGRVHNTIRDQIDYPYKSFQHDKLDGKKKWVVYVLYPREALVQKLNLNWFEDANLPQREEAFQNIPLHLLLKLLQTGLFRGEESSRFVGQDKCYVYAKSAGGDFHYCVEVELKGALTNKEGAPTQEFRVIPHAKRFGKSDPPFQPSHTFFGKRPVGNKTLFIHLKSEAVAQEPTVYHIVTFSGKRAQVKFHDPHNLDESRGKIVFDFNHQFLEYLKELGIMGRIRERTFNKVPKLKEAFLPVERLSVIGIYDNRLKRTRSVSKYISLLRGMYPDIVFIELEDIKNAPQGGGLILLDAKAEDFEEDGILSKEIDPYHTLYADHPDIPKQSLNVNPNDPNTLEGGYYLDYPVVQPQDDDFQRKLAVALNELYLKCAILHGLERFPLPLIPGELAFVRKGRFGGETFITALWFEEKRLCFANLADPTQSSTFYTLLDTWNVRWDEQYDLLLEERRRMTEDGTLKDLPHFDIIVGRDLFVAIEDLEERILFDYNEISRRKQEKRITYPVEQLRLAPYYDDIKNKSMLLLAELSQKGLLDGREKPTTVVARQSVTFYKQLFAYDVLLKEIAVTHPILSYEELTSGEWLERICHIFGSKANSEGKYHRRVIADIYQGREMFLSEKGQDIYLYQGIWHDNTNAFLVGSPTGMNVQGQERAHLIRRFQIMQGSTHFDKEQLLSTMGVSFVRHKQYTVSPYYFHLIDLYIENVLRYTLSDVEVF